MAQPLESSLPAIDLLAGMKVVFEALDPTTGNAVAGVKVTAVAIYGRPPASAAGADTGLEVTGPFVLVPGPGA